MPSTLNISELTIPNVLSPPQTEFAGWTQVNTSEFSFQVAVGYNDSFLCGGAIYSTLLVLTAAHCVMNKNKTELKVVAGFEDGHVISENVTQTRSVVDISIYDRYDMDSVAYDIAILHLDEELEYTPHVQNVSLPDRQRSCNGVVTATGWNKTEEQGTPFMVLNKLELQVVDWDECESKYEETYNITNEMMCAENEEQDTCQNDGGGLLLGKNKDGTLVLCGITNSKSCNSSGLPNVYSEMLLYKLWIFLFEDLEPSLSDRTVLETERLYQKCSTDYIFCTSESRCVTRQNLCNGDDTGKSCELYALKGSANETECKSTTSCPSNQFRCSNGLCIKRAFVCDGNSDCHDGSDEYKCPSKNDTCGELERKCGDQGRCIPASQDTWWCDGHKDCDDNSDEENCEPDLITTTSASTKTKTTIKPPCDPNALYCFSTSSSAKPACAANQFYCSADSSCMPNQFVCDGHADCDSGEDEEGCESDSNETTSTTTTTTTSRPACAADEFYCSADSECIPNQFICDGDVDCSSGVDEENCPSTTTTTTTSRPTCAADEFYCSADSECISNQFICDGDVDCSSGVDEENCPSTTTTTTSTTTRRPFCAADEFYCSPDSKCISTRWVCDGDVDCPSGVDEQNCTSTTTTTTSTTTRRPSCAADEFYCSADSKCIPDYYVCDGDVDCPSGVDEQNCPPTISRTTTNRPRPRPRPSCAADEFYCSADSKCIPDYFVCDGDVDCPSGVDEQNCPPTISRTTTNRPRPRPSCAADEFYCSADSKCLPKRYVCDGDVDCSSGVDEQNCAPTTTRPSRNIPSCSSDEFYCSTDSKCISHDWVCDGDIDCLSGIDELNCDR